MLSLKELNNARRVSYLETSRINPVFLTRVTIEKRMTITAQDHFWMQKAMKMADLAMEFDEVPVGAVLVYKNTLISEAHNQPITLHDPTAHAEILCLRQAGKFFKNYRLNQTTLYITLEPCAMCATAIMHARIQRVIFGASDLKAGAMGGHLSIPQTLCHLHKNIKIISGLYAQENSDKLKNYFITKRKKT